jgi:hypothetical protein
MYQDQRPDITQYSKQPHEASFNVQISPKCLDAALRDIDMHLRAIDIMLRDFDP